jgi:hypothetical protein
MNADKFRRLFAEQQKKLEAASRTLENQIGAIEREIQQRKRLKRELDDLISKYWPDEPDGRPGIWKGQDGYDLVLRVEAMRKRFGYSSKDAIKDLRKTKWPPYDQYSEESLVARYYDAKRHWEPAIRRLREIGVEHDALNAEAQERQPPMTFDEVRDLVNRNRKKSASTADASD